MLLYIIKKLQMSNSTELTYANNISPTRHHHTLKIHSDNNLVD